MEVLCLLPGMGGQNRGGEGDDPPVSLVFVQTGKPALQSRHAHSPCLPCSCYGSPQQNTSKGGGALRRQMPNPLLLPFRALKGSCISVGEAGAAGAKARPNETMPLGLFHLPVEREPRAVPLSVVRLQHRRAGATNTCRVLESSMLWEGQDVLEEWPQGTSSSLCHEADAVLKPGCV